jgi:hypothetical protein
MAIEVDPPVSPRDFDDVRWYLLHRDVSVFRDEEGCWYVEFATPCEELDSDGRCRRYATRPALCRDHGKEPGSCEFFRTLYTERFETVDEFEHWLAEGRGNASPRA